jgi:Rrf2 family protein
MEIRKKGNACASPDGTATERVFLRAGTPSMLSQKAKYAIKALLVLARAGGGDLVQANQIAEEQNIPKKFLDLIFFELRRHGLIQSTRGREGGYALAMPAAEISIASIVRAVDGPLAPLPCASVKFYRRCSDCDDEKTCAVRKLMREVRDAASAILDNTSLAEAASLPVRGPHAKKRTSRKTVV